jgi:recombination protein RecT
VIYEGDDFVYAIDPETGLTKIVKHDQKIENIDVSKIKGAYAIAKKQDGSSLIEIKTISQIKQAWLQSPTKGQSPAHKNFPDQMAKRTVISAVCKMVVNSSDDAWLYEGKKDEFDASPVDQRNAEISASTGNKFIEEASYEEVKPASAPSTQSETTASKEQNNAPQAKESAPVDEPGY